ncbi:hypothetical protein N7495_000635 [Penicillium taxi]|uniref:uncharacterized protein n=1 Tax=Penicillium taxi TaxID=168475 RepID=UPI002544D3E1|nr:uncharacterized protein N7495_000635 [Penicillium taxi]KAJ5907953.1 hypothetical protein N7495_000635 [Penicillium taxi]
MGCQVATVILAELGWRLCALSTIGIATSGFALGRVDRSKNTTWRRKLLRNTPCDSNSILDVRPETAQPARLNSEGARWIGDKRPDRHGQGHRPTQSQGSDFRRNSLTCGAAHLRRRGQTLASSLTSPFISPLASPPLEITEEQPIEPQSQRGPTRWLRRLSLASIRDNATHGSTMPSHGSSPATSRPASQQQTNRLIKRVPSHLSNVHPSVVNTSDLPPPITRRPATSDQKPRSRPQSMRLDSLREDPLRDFNFDNYSPQPVLEESEFDIDEQDGWKPYLTPNPDKLSEKPPRKLSINTTRMQPVRLIIPDQESLPALVLSTAFTKQVIPGCEPEPEPEPELEAVVEPESIIESESIVEPELIPPVLFSDPFQAQSPPPSSPPRPDSPKQREHRQTSSLDKEPKRILVNTVTASGQPIIGPQRGGSLKRVKGRNFGTDLSPFDIQSPIIGRSPFQRRNITDPSVFRRPQPISPTFSISPFNRAFQLVPRSVSQDYNFSQRRQRPLTSDAVAVSTWQHACRPSEYKYTSLRRRPKRHSFAESSNRSSTIMGSDDTRVFTTSDEYETDMVTDYWDSVRTRRTSASGLQGLRIETMFDKEGLQLSNEEVTTLEDLLPRGSFNSRLEREPPFYSATLPSPRNRVHVDEIDCLFDDEDSYSMIADLPSRSRHMRNQPEQLTSPNGSQLSQKMNIFDWSEHSHSRADRDLSDSETRPRTVHGKQNAVNRDSRAACRKVSSTIHLRSQSVPVANDFPVSSERQTPGKFATWKLGMKGVSEDWDSDFDFEDDSEENTAVQTANGIGPDVVPHSMSVPQAILARQASLRGQFGQVQELTLLVEELKRLRHQASVLDILGGPSGELWKEAEGIVNLATIDDEEERRSPLGSQLSPPSLVQSKDSSESPEQRRGGQGFSSPLRPMSNTPKPQSVLDILQPGQRPKSAVFTGFTPSQPPQKLPFDTSSLRDLVVRAGVVTRALKEVIRKAEGVDPSSHDAFPSDPPFRRIFDQPSHVVDIGCFEAALADMH